MGHRAPPPLALGDDDDADQGRAVPRPRGRGPLPAHPGAQDGLARREGRAALVRARRGPLRAGRARRAVLRDRERPGRTSSTASRARRSGSPRPTPGRSSATSRPSRASPRWRECVASEPTETIAFDRAGLRAHAGRGPGAWASCVLGCLLARRAWHEGDGHGVLRLIAERGSRRAFEVRDLLERNLVPLRFHDVDLDPMADKILDWLEIPREETPVLVRHDRVLRNPSAAQVARELGLRAEVDGQRFDLVVLGAGPAGLAAAVSGGSEGMRTLVAEAWGPGGQAGTSNRIENYLGFAERDLGRRADPGRDAAGAPLRRGAVELPPGGRADRRAGGPRARRPRRRPARPGPGGGHGHGSPLARAGGAGRRALSRGRASTTRPCRPTPSATADEDVLVVGGGNSAGQAATHLARHARSVRVAVRGDGLSGTMSRYLVDRVERSPAHRGADPDGGGGAARPRRARRASRSATATAARSGCRCGRCS